MGHLVRKVQTCPSATSNLRHICSLLSNVWNLPVVCECMTEEVRTCKGSCMTPSLIGLGFMAHLHQGCPPLIYAQPSGLTSSWHLKYTVTPQTPHRHAHKQISNIIVGVVLTVFLFLHTWISCLLSITTWAQVACLSGYSRSTVLSALHSAVPPIISKLPWDLDNTLQWCCPATCILPSTRDIVFFRLHRWAQQHPVWSRPTYASWHMPHGGTCRDFCAHWCHDFPVLRSLTQLSYPAIGPVHSNPLGA